MTSYLILISLSLMSFVIFSCPECVSQELSSVQEMDCHHSDGESKATEKSRPSCVMCLSFNQHLPSEKALFFDFTGRREIPFSKGISFYNLTQEVLVPPPKTLS